MNASNVSIDEWRHLSCASPNRCHCDCQTCRRAWVLAGFPQQTVPCCASVHVVLSVPDARSPVETRASA